MCNGNSMIEAYDYMEQTGCDLAEALEALNWQETEIRRKENGKRENFSSVRQGKENVRTCDEVRNEPPF